MVITITVHSAKDLPERLCKHPQARGEHLLRLANTEKIQSQHLNVLATLKLEERKPLAAAYDAGYVPMAGWGDGCFHDILGTSLP